jgi:hypothetical protein
MRWRTSMVFVIACAANGGLNAHEIDASKITRGEFLARGHDNMEAMISWLRGDQRR